MNNDYEILQEKYEKLNIEYSKSLNQINEMQQKLAGFSLIKEVTYACGSLQDIDELLNTITDIVIGLSGVYSVSIVIKNNDDFKINKKYVEYIEELSKERLSKNYRNIKKELEQNNGCTCIEDFSKEKFSIKEGSCLIVELKSLDSIGFIYMYHKQPNFFTSVLVDMFKLISSELAVFIKNAFLIKEKEIMIYKDSLTGINNRFFYNEYIDKKDTKDINCIIMIDIDKFKNVNDNYGHSYGDKVLRTLGNILKEISKDNIIPCRYGGEEFSILLKNIKKEEARCIAEDIRSLFNKLVFKTKNGNKNFSLSAGIAYRDYDYTINELQEYADSALYVSKEEGRNRVTIYKA